MTDQTIRPCYRGRDNKSLRVLPGVHLEDCGGGECRGCAPCPAPHCTDCGRVHVVGTELVCPACVATVRENLETISELYDTLDWEAEQKGVTSAAADLLGPVADRESWDHHTACALGGRIVPADCDARELEDVRAWYDRADRDTHPLWATALHADRARETLGHTVPEATVTVAGEVAYLQRHLTELARCEHFDWPTMATHLRRARTRLDVVVHDEAEGDRANVGCFDCHGDLERKLTDHGFDDHWTCRRCRRRYTPTDYNLALRSAIEADAERRAATQEGDQSA